MAPLVGASGAAERARADPLVRDRALGVVMDGLRPRPRAAFADGDDPGNS
jgi:hypothetical protein